MLYPKPEIYALQDAEYKLKKENGTTHNKATCWGVCEHCTNVAPIALCIIRFQIIKQGIVKIAKDEAKNPIFEEIAKKPRKVKEYSKLWFNFF